MGPGELDYNFFLEDLCPNALIINQYHYVSS